jgi:hypothetical protein
MGRTYSYFGNRSFIFLISSLFLFIEFSCSKPQIRFDNVYNGDNYTNLVEVDTFTVKLSTVYLDSFQTSGTKVQLLGRYIDPFFGVITSRSFTQFGTPVPLPVITNYSIYDSIKLITRIDRTYYGDTSKLQRFNVSQLTQVMNFPPNQTSFYSNSSIPYDPTVLGSSDVLIRPVGGFTGQGNGDSVIIKMPDSMGEDLFGLLYRNSDTITNANIFQNYFKGLTVYPDTSLPGAIYGFKDSMFLRIYYHEPGVTINYKTTDFPIIAQNTQFNQIKYDRSGTPTAPLNALNPELPSTSSGNQAFLQPITSLYVKLLFPTISDLLGYQDYLTVMKAQLIVKPVAGTYSPAYSLPPLVPLAPTTEANTIGLQLPFGNGALNVDYVYGTNTNYSYDITTYIQAALNQGAPNNAKNGIILITPATIFNTNFSRAVIGDEFNALKSNQISLQIFYASYY